MNAIDALKVIQNKLEAPKNQNNTFGGYRYRSLEDICAALKPLLEETSTAFIMRDDIVQVGERIYVRATATLIGDDNSEAQTTAWAREPAKRTGMDEAQVTGATSSYARKYAANALFCIDDTKDPDSLPPDNGKQEQPSKTTQSQPKVGTKKNSQSPNSSAGKVNKETLYQKLVTQINDISSIDSLLQWQDDNRGTVNKELGGTEYLDMFKKDFADKQAKLISEQTK